MAVARQSNFCKSQHRISDTESFALKREVSVEPITFFSKQVNGSPAGMLAGMGSGKPGNQMHSRLMRSQELKGRCILLRVFNRVMRVISSLIGLLMFLMGGIWVLQGFDLAWGEMRRSFMEGDQHWALYGGIMAVIGICQVVWSNTRQNIT